MMVLVLMYNLHATLTSFGFCDDLRSDHRFLVKRSEASEMTALAADRIVSVDGQLVGTNAEIQRALRGHPIGESMPMEVVRAGESQEISVARVSDLPS